MFTDRLETINKESDHRKKRNMNNTGVRLDKRNKKIRDEARKLDKKGMKASIIYEQLAKKHKTSPANIKKICTNRRTA